MWLKELFAVRNYGEVLDAFKKLRDAFPNLLEKSGLTHRQVWEYVKSEGSGGVKLGKDTFYRRLREQDWRFEELELIFPFIMKAILQEDPDYYHSALLPSVVPDDS